MAYDQEYILTVAYRLSKKDTTSVLFNAESGLTTTHSIKVLQFLLKNNLNILTSFSIQDLALEDLIDIVETVAAIESEMAVAPQITDDGCCLLIGNFPGSCQSIGAVKQREIFMNNIMGIFNQRMETDVMQEDTTHYPAWSAYSNWGEVFSQIINSMAKVAFVANSNDAIVKTPYHINQHLRYGGELRSVIPVQEMTHEILFEYAVLLFKCTPVAIQFDEEEGHIVIAYNPPIIEHFIMPERVNANIIDHIQYKLLPYTSNHYEYLMDNTSWSERIRMSNK